MSQTILFFGNERLATGVTTEAPVLRALSAKYKIAGVVVAQNELGRSRADREPEIIDVARHSNIPVLAPKKLAEARDELAAFQAQIGVLVAYGKIVPQEIIDLFPKGIINIHPSLLPKHRGPTPVESVILNGEAETGVSLMQLTSQMDAGPVYAQQTLTLTGNEEKQLLADKLALAGKDMLMEALPGILNGELLPKPQAEASATYDSLIDKSSGSLDFTKPAEQLEREVRAYAGWPRSSTKIGDTDVIVT